MTAVVSLHQVDLALAYADRLIGLVGGRVVLDAAPESLRREALDVLYARVQPHPTTMPARAVATAAFLSAQENA
jgi:phosphonate transport system ATP-binding protein